MKKHFEVTKVISFNKDEFSHLTIEFLEDRHAYIDTNNLQEHLFPVVCILLDDTDIIVEDLKPVVQQELEFIEKTMNRRDAVYFRFLAI